MEPPAAHMSILVTGGAGYVGSIAVERLVQSGFPVVVLDNLATGHRRAVPAGIPFEEGDIGAPDEVRRVLRTYNVTAVLHFAGDPVVERSMRDPGACFRTNVSKGIVLLDAMLETGCRSLVFSSTCAIFGEPARTPIDEEHPANPINPYGRSKLMFEQVLEWYQRSHGLRFIALRYFNAAGATERLGEDHRPESHLVPRLCDAAARSEPVRIFGSDYPTPDGTCVRDYVHVLDLAEAHILALRHMDEWAGHTFNLGSGRGVSNLEMLRAVERVVGAPIPFEFAPRRPGDPAVLVAGSAKARQALGWSPQFETLDPLVRSAWEWRRRNPNGYGVD